ncbi:MAG: MarR family EPS-associated transcriptional regulator [Gammaproteobacteria bacterium]|nr:MarR family EPS-associated transcriptional regulator [Gammaproteobacteria bacterium]
MINDEIEYRLLKLLEKDPHLSQRALAKQTGVSLGKVNYCLRALVDTGIIKAKNFYHNQNKLAYAYFLTPKGLQEKAHVTYRFLQRKIDEYETLRVEIETLRAEFVRGLATEQSHQHASNSDDK